MRTSFPRQAMLGLSLLVSLLLFGDHLPQAHARPAQAAFFQEPAPEEAQKEQVYRWEKIALRHADAVTLSAMLGGVVGPSQVLSNDIDRGLGVDENVELLGGAMSNIVPDGIQGIIALPGTNRLLVRGTSDDIAELRDLVANFDYPQPRYRLTLWSDTQTMSMTVLEREIAHFADRSPSRRLKVDVSARATDNGAIVVRLSGTAGAGQRECLFSSITSLKPGIKTRALEFDSPNGRSSIYLRVEVDP